MKKVHSTQMGSVKHSEQNGTKASLIKVSVDQAKAHYYVVRQVDNGPTQPPQRMEPEKFLHWVEKQRALASRVVVCYEAGPFGFVLARRLSTMGVECLVMAPVKLDEQNRRVNTDKTDALEIANRLDRYLAGQKRALRVVHLPSEEEEQQRAESRGYEQLMRHQRRVRVQAKSLLLAQGYDIKGQWWGPKTWPQWQKKFPQWIVELLESHRALLVCLDAEIKKRAGAIAASAEKHLPKDMSALPIGWGEVTWELTRRELGDPHRFKNRRAVGSITGLCPSEASTGQTRRQGPITKVGNPRLRAPLIELAWRLSRTQPNYPPVIAYWKRIGDKTKSTASARKKAIVMLARRVAIDLWRLLSGQCTARELKLALKGNKFDQAVAQRAGALLGAHLVQG